MTGPRSEIGMMFQDATLLPWKTALDNVLFPLAITGGSAAERREDARRCCSRVGLDGFEDKRPSQLSGGMRQRVALCRALITRPELLLHGRAVQRARRHHARRDERRAHDICGSSTGRRCVFVTHSIREAVFLSDRVLVMSQRPGRLLTDMPIDIPRPRHPDVGETPRFNEICGQLRRMISIAHGHASG